MLISEKTIVDCIQAWTRNHKEEIVRSYCRKPGWERWLEEELARQLRSLPGRPRVTTAVHAYGNGEQALDVTITAADGPVFVIELKHEGVFAPLGTAALRRGELSYARFEEDVHKLRRRRSAAGSVMAILVAVCDEAQASIQSLVAAYSVEKRTFNATDDWTLALYRY